MKSRGLKRLGAQESAGHASKLGKTCLVGRSGSQAVLECGAVNFHQSGLVTACLRRGHGRAVGSGVGGTTATAARSAHGRRFCVTDSKENEARYRLSFGEHLVEDPALTLALGSLLDHDRILHPCGYIFLHRCADSRARFYTFAYRNSFSGLELI